jgi:hypothetical protein
MYWSKKKSAQEASRIKTQRRSRVPIGSDNRQVHQQDLFNCFTSKMESALH